MSINITDKEKEFLIMLLQASKVIIKNSGGAYRLNSDRTFSCNDLLTLAYKFHLENYY